MAKFNLTTVLPEGFMHHHAFDEIRESLSWAIAALGHDVAITENWFSESGETNIILGAELIADFQRLPRNTVLFNLEQPSHPNMSKVQRMALESKCRVWDYSLRAIEEWKAIGVSAVHVPIGYTPNLTRIPKATPDFDVCFFGWSTPRRRVIIEMLTAEGLKVYAGVGCYGGARDNIISRSKVCLNVHHDGRDRFEAVRCSYLMANHKCIVTEESSDDDEYQDMKSLNRVPYRLLVDTCVSLCRDSASTERAAQAASAYYSIHRRDFTKSVAAALDGSVTSGTVEPRSRALARYNAACASGDMKDFMEWMYQHAQGNIVEIGTRDGASTSAFLLGVEQRGGHVYSIDVNDCSHLFRGHPQWTFIHGNSSDGRVMRKVPRDIDVLLIDGDHTHDGVFSDFYNYSQLVKFGGLILFHDIAPEPNPGNVPDWPDDSVKNFYQSLVDDGWKHEELPGRYGMGVLKVSARVEATAK